MEKPVFWFYHVICKGGKKMLCVKCKAILPENANFCPECGYKVEQIPSKERQGEESLSKPETFEMERINFEIPDMNIRQEPKRNKGSVFAVSGLLLTVLVVVIVLAVSIFGQGNAKRQIKAAALKTIQILNEEAKNPSLLTDAYTFRFELSSNSYQNSGYSRTEGEPTEIRMFLTANGAQTSKDIYGSLEIGLDTFDEICLHYIANQDGFYLTLPNLSSKTLYFPQEMMEEASEADMDILYDEKAEEEAIASLTKIVRSIYEELYADAKCKRLGKETLTSQLTNQEEIKTNRYKITVSASKYRSCLNAFPERLQEDQVFMGWLEELFSKSAAENLMDLMQEAIEQYEIPEEAHMVVLGYVNVDEKGRIVQVEIPIKEGGELILSFLGGERLSDSIRFGIRFDDNNSEREIDFLFQSNVSLEEQSKDLDKEHALLVSEDNWMEFEAVLIEILQSLSEGNYLPYLYREDLSEFIDYYSDVSDWDVEEDWGFDSEIRYSETGNPILVDSYGQEYEIEIIAPNGLELDLDWSYSDYISFTNADGTINCDYYITILEDDKTDQFGIYDDDFHFPFQKYQCSEIMQKKINGYQVYYQFCSYELLYDENCKYCVAWVRLDKEKVFQIYLSDYTNSVDDDILEEIFQINLPVQN